ncbi:MULTISPECIES: RagB/SusD family nutrient uptake outer membrane protein [Parabacteroides]|uniref:RagB/SusD family nutrient uptake outer membrane protein n=1 Tax=Parabacteroides leei TaxID=2939491 RepID=UPI00189BB953|nr:RagB/SusD family nutrient uptake outer membrane protein [Parabacteroides goldsteinii]
MKKIKYIVASLLLLGTITSCNDFLTVSSPDQLTNESFWRDKSDAEAGLAAAYSQLESFTDTWSFSEVKWPVEAYREDIVNLGSDAFNYPNWVELANFTYTNGNSQFTYYWQDAYRGINYCNQVIENVPNIPAEEITEEERNTILNEAYFLRGYYHMKLLLNWKEIVIRDAYISSTDQLDKALATREEAWDFIIGELTKATTLPESRTSDQLGRATKGAAYAYIGWAHLTRAYEESGNKDTELKAAVDAFNNVKGYDLVKDFKSMFDGSNKNSKEGIFELQMSMSDANGAWYKTQLHRWIGCSELRGWDEILPNTMLMNEYMKEGRIATTGRYDSRLYETIFFQCDYFNDPEAGRVYGYTYDDWFDGKNKPAFRKFMPVDYEGMENNYFAPNIPLMRYSNVLLMKAEALNELGQTAEAISLINQVRERADMPNMKGTSQAQVREQIEHERILEFPLENFRFYDLRRWGKTQEALKAVGRDFNPEKNSFYPIPIQEINTNNALH